MKAHAMRRNISARPCQGKASAPAPPLPGGTVPGHSCAMRAILQTNDPVRLSFLAALLRDAGIDCVVLDTFASAVEGSIGAIPRRLMVAMTDEARARAVLREAGEA